MTSSGPRIAARLGAGPLFQTPSQGGGAASGAPAAANDPAWSGVRFWQLVSGLSMAAAVVMASVLVSQRLPGHDPSPQVAQIQAPRYLAVLQRPDKPGAGWVVETVASADTQPGEAAIRLVPLGASDDIPEGKTMQFWTKPEGAKGPTSLGLVKPGQVVVVELVEPPALFGQPVGRVKEVLGEVDDPGMEIEIAVRKAFLSLKLDSAPADNVSAAVTKRIIALGQNIVGIEEVQDIVQEELMRLEEMLQLRN